MKRITDFLYEVKLHEQVTVAITPSVNLGQLYTANLDAHEMAKPANGIYSFTVTRPIGKTHFLIIVFSFLGAPNGSQYSVAVNSVGNTSGPFSLTVEKDDPNPVNTFRFKVVA